MAKKYLDYDGLLYFWQKIKTVFVPTTRKVNGKALSADITLSASDVSALPSSTTIPSPGTGSNYPAMDGTRALGSNAGYARVDHVHPSDTSRVPTSRTINSKALSSNIVLTGSDIAADSTTSATIAETFAAMEGEFATALDGKVDKVDGKGLSTNDYTTTEKNKLAGIATGAEVNQNAFSNITVGNTTIEADAKTDTLTLVAGSNIALTPDATSDQVTIAFNGTIPSVPTYLTPYGQGYGICNTAASTSAKDVTLSGFQLKKNGFVAVRFSAGCTSLRSLNINSTGVKYIYHKGTTTTSSTQLSRVRLQTNMVAYFMYDGTNYNLIDWEHTDATTDTDGYMTTFDKIKLNGIASNAEVNQNAFSNITVGSTTIEADEKTDTLTLEAGSGITLTPDATNDKVTIALNGTIPTIPNNFGTVKVGSTNIVADTTSDTLELAAGSNITLTPDATNDKVTIAATNTTYSDFTGATSDAAGTHGLVPAPAAGVGAGMRVLTAAGGFEPLDLDVRTGLGVPKQLIIELTVGNSGHVLYVPVATTEADGAMSADDKSKLNGIAEGAQVNQNAFSNVAVGSTTIAADTKTDTLTLTGSNVTLTPDASADKVTIGITASNVTTALGNTAVARATGDASGNNIANTYAPKASPTFSGTPIAPTAAAGTNTQQIATTAFVTSAIQTAQTGAATFQGTAPTSFAPTNYKKGYYWVVGTAGTYVTQTCEPGDMIFAIKDYGTAYAASDFNVIQTNLDITSIPNADIDTIVAS